MANINKIRLSGQTYNIEDVNATKTVELTQAQYDALTVKDPNTFYVITDAQGVDLSNYYTKSETSGATEISTALNAKQDTLVSGTNIKTINNESILGSGNIDIQGGGGDGKSISAGTNISITTGDTADTINCTLPITTAIDNTSLNFGFNTINSELSYSFGNANTVGRSRYYGSYSMAVGLANTTNAEAQFVTGYNNKLLNHFEFGSGHFNNSVLASAQFGDSGNTLFSVGNGTEDNARHNAFEIRQNGDIYITLNDQDVKLQDHLGGGGGSITIDPSLNSGSTNPVANSAITNALHETYFYNIAKESDSQPQTKFQLLWKYIDTKQTTFFNPSFVIAGINGTKIASLGSNPDRTNFELVETSAITTSISSSSTDAQVPSAKAVNDKLGGLSIVKMTQSEYDNLSTKDNSTLYIVTDS